MVEQPTQGHLCRGRSKLFANIGKSSLGGSKRRTMLHRVGSQRAIRHERKSFASAIIHHGISLALSNAVSVLHRSDLGNCPCFFKLFNRDIAKAYQPNFAFLLESSQSQHGFTQRHIRIDPMKLYRSMQSTRKFLRLSSQSRRRPSGLPSRYRSLADFFTTPPLVAMKSPSG